ncbi:MAG TPA: methylmalonyl Co-A mutase-associated GTPase MeaB [Anaerolineales bacterium]|jgi:LAO/AO transport system kinase
MALVEQVLDGDRLALARLLTLVENDDPQGLATLDALYPHTGNAHIIGLTGGTGTGKSTLVNQLARYVRQQGIPGNGGAARQIRIAVVAVDPTSPFSGGAILGDRIRMRDLAGDPNVFIRSMATRGALGGLALRTRPVVQTLDAAGYDWVLVETVGAGQSEVEVARTAHTTIVVDAPGLGDEVQAIKAGILETADVLVLNKADLPGADRAATALRTSLRLGPSDSEAGNGGWQVPILMTVATEGNGIAEVVEAISRHRTHLQASGEWVQRVRLRVERELRELLAQTLLASLLDRQPEGAFAEIVNQVEERKLSPRAAVAQLTQQARA